MNGLAESNRTVFCEQLALGLCSLAGYGLFEALTTATELGYQSIVAFPDGPRAEHSLGPFSTLGFYGSSEEDGAKTIAALAPFKRISIHQAWDNHWQRWIDCAVHFGAEIVTVHSGRRSENQSSDQFVMERAAHLRRIGDHAGKNGILIGVENEGGRLSDYLGLIHAVGHPFVGATIDVGHCAYFEDVLAVTDRDERTICLNDTIRGIVKTLGKKVLGSHVHDVRRDDWRDHRWRAPYVVDFPSLLAELRSIGYSGLFEVELEEPDKEARAAEAGTYLTVLWESMLGRT